MIIKKGAAAANRRIYGRIENLEGTAPTDKSGGNAVKVVNGVAPGGNWTNTLVYDSNSGDHYVELTAAELAALSDQDTVSWGYSASGVRTAVPIVAQVEDYLEGSLTWKAAFRIMLAALAGRTTDAQTVFRDVANTKARITSTVDVVGDRTAITLDGTD